MKFLYKQEPQWYRLVLQGHQGRRSSLSTLRSGIATSKKRIAELKYAALHKRNWGWSDRFVCHSDLFGSALRIQIGARCGETVRPILPFAQELGLRPTWKRAWGPVTVRELCGKLVPRGAKSANSDIPNCHWI